MLDERGVEYHYREYTEDPLSEEEIHELLEKLRLGAKDVLRTRDEAFSELSLTGEEEEDRLISLMSSHPTLLQRPIGVVGDRAIVGRPAERLLELL